MAYSYGGHINFDLSIDFQNKAPLDIRVVVPTIPDLETITNPYIGLLSYVVSALRVFVCKAIKNNIGVWEQLAADSGLPIYTLEMYDALEEKPEQYIHVHDPSEIDGCIEETKTYSTSINGTYVDVLFSALRALLTEVAKLRNSFIYGINSYNDTDTALSSIQHEYGDDIDEEPLWAISETDLTELLDVYMIDLFTPAANVEVVGENVFNVIGTAAIADLNEYAPKDTKVVAYITADKPNITAHIGEAVLGELATTNIGKNVTRDNDIIFDLDLTLLLFNAAPMYNIMLVLSRTIEERGDNYLWISIDDQTKDFKLIEGYYNPETKKVQDEKYLLDDACGFLSIDFTNTQVSKFKLYSKFQDFSESVIASKPSEQDYKYRTAHITIRSVKNYSVLESIAKQILNNELVMVEEDYENKKSGLYIKNRDILIPIGGTSTNNPNLPDTPMDKEELLSMLKEMGIVYTEDGETLELANISDLTFIHQETGKIYKVNIDAYGNLTSELLNGTTGTEERLAAVNQRAPLIEPDASGKYTMYTRGFVGLLGLGEYFYEVSSSIKATSDIKLYADRVKIGAFYAPRLGRSVYGCSHGFVLLENTGLKDFDLTGTYLHFVHPQGNTYTVDHLALKGTIAAGGTYLIRCKQYAEFTDANTFIKVLTYDQEWYSNKELLDLTFDPSSSSGYGFALTYGEPELAYNTQLVTGNDQSYADDKTNAYMYMPYYIDSVYFHKIVKNSSDAGYWTGVTTCMDLVVNKSAAPYTNDVIFRNSFMLDPAKQAFQGLNAKDSSRLRNANVADYYYIPLEKEFIEFPKSDEKYPVSNFTPKASFEHANVCTDKSKLNADIPNMVTCAFGIALEKTRCFNWVSVGLFDEYIWIKEAGKDSWQWSFESYTESSAVATKLPDTTQPYRVFFKAEINNPVYARITSRFPADNTQFTVHKCIVTFPDSLLALTSPKEFTYIVGRADKDGNPDPNHVSAEHSFKLYPKSWHPRIYQTSDQQGFHWVEYQVWNATAKQLEEQIDSDYAAATDKFIPVLLNTGDMTQSGARINEWYDYYQAGKNLFKRMEQVNVVGNNDLCGTDPLELGTGDDAGKSNSYYFHLFYCYEVDPTIPPIINGKYVPSLYYIDFDKYRLLLVNSELTQENSLNWFGLKKGTSAVNPYTGWAIPFQKQASTEADIAVNYYESDDFMPVYTMIYKMMDTDKNIIPACHEMPFTVITAENLLVGTKEVSRSLSGTSLVGCHMNQLNGNDTKATYWFSRLLEYKGVKLCLGGHKHTYAVTYPLREYYQYGDKDSMVNGPMKMEESLKYDNVNFVWDGKDHTKFPLMTYGDDSEGTDTMFFPKTKTVAFVSNSDVPYTHGVVYFMCQSSGFKLFSNKELPSVDLKFSQFIPKSTVSASGAYSAAADQRSPMYAIIDANNSGTYTISLVKLVNIQITPTGLLTPLSYGTADIKVQSLQEASSGELANYGTWVDGIKTLMTI